MDWVPEPWEAACGDSVVPSPASRPPDASQVPPGTEAKPPDLDIALIALIYRSIAAGSLCETCGAHFARWLRVIPSPADSPSSRELLVVAKCRGWRRHVHAARVGIDVGYDIPLEPLKATG